MKNKIFILIMTTLFSIFPMIGCDIYSDNPDNICGGIIKSVTIVEKYREITEEDMFWGQIESGYFPELTVTYEESAVGYYFPTLTVTTSDFTTFNCKTLKELLRKKEYKEYLISKYENVIAYEYIDKETSTYLILNNHASLAYTLYYEKSEDVPTITYKDIDLSSYIGYIKYN